MPRFGRRFAEALIVPESRLAVVLDAPEEWFRAHQVPLAQYAAPGASTERIEAVFAELPPCSNEFAPGWRLRSLDWASADLRIERDLMRKFPDSGAWRTSWFPLLRSTSGGLLAVDCSEPANPAAPVWLSNKADHGRPAFDSLAGMVEFFLELLDRRIVRWLPETQWDVSDERWPLDQRLLL